MNAKVGRGYGVHEGETETLDIILDHPFKILIIRWVDVLKIVVRQWLPEDVLVKRACEVGVKHVSIEQRLPNKSPDELEILQVVGLDVGLRARLKRVAVLGGDEETVARVEERAGELEEPFSRQSTSILAFFSFKRDLQFSFELIRVP